MTRNSERHLRRSTRNKNTPPAKQQDFTRKKSCEDATKTCKRKREPSSSGNGLQSKPPIKRTRRLSSSKENSSDEKSSSVASKTFYGKSRQNYLTPIQRRDISEHKFEFQTKEASGNIKQEPNLASVLNKRHSARGSAYKSRKGSLSKNDQKTLRAKALKKLSPSTVIKVLDLSTGTDSKEEEDSVKSEETPRNTPQSSKNKFFKHKSPGKKAKLTLAKHGVSRKGFNLSFHSKRVKNESVTESVLVKSCKRVLTNESKCDLVLAAENFRKNKEKLRHLKKVELIEESDTDDLTNVRSDHVNSPAGAGYIPDFAEDESEDITDQSAELTVSQITQIRSEPAETPSGRSSAMSNCSDKWSTCSTGADSVILLPEPSSDEKRYASKSVLPVTVQHNHSDECAYSTKLLESQENTDMLKSTVSSLDKTVSESVTGVEDSLDIVHSTDTESAKDDGETICSARNKDISDTVDNAGCEMFVSIDSEVPSSPESSINESEDVQNITVNIKERVSAKKLFPIFNPSAQSSPNPRKLSCTPPGGSRLRSSLTPPKQSLLDTPQSSSSSTRSSPKHVWKKAKAKDGMEQMMLDCGQKLQGPLPCSLCGMMYSRGDSVDESEHSKMHQRYINILKFPGWSKERVVQHVLDGSKILMVLPEDKKCMKKVSAVMQLVDRDLGFVMRSDVSGKEPVQSITMPYSRAKFFLYISADKRVVGFCAVQVISKGYRVLSEQAVNKRMSTSPTKRQRPRCCSTKPEPARCGVNRVWVLHSERRKGVATQLLDSVRFNFVVGNILTPAELAFSDPTPDGLRLAASYTGTPHFLVYKPR